MVVVLQFGAAKVTLSAKILLCYRDFIPKTSNKTPQGKPLRRFQFLIGSLPLARCAHRELKWRKNRTSPRPASLETELFLTGDIPERFPIGPGKKCSDILVETEIRVGLFSVCTRKQWRGGVKGLTPVRWEAQSWCESANTLCPPDLDIVEKRRAA